MIVRQMEANDRALSAAKAEAASLRAKLARSEQAAAAAAAAGSES